MTLIGIYWLSWMIFTVIDANSLIRAHEHEFSVLAINKLRREMRKYEISMNYAHAMDADFYDDDWYEWDPFEALDAENVLGHNNFNRETDVNQPIWRQIYEKDLDGDLSWTKHHIVGIKPIIAFWNRAIKYGHKAHLKWAAYGLFHTLVINDDRKVYAFPDDKDQLIQQFLHQFEEDCKSGNWAKSTKIWNAKEKVLKQALTEMLAWLPGNIFLGPPSRGDDPGNSFEVAAGPLINGQSAEHYGITFKFFQKMEHWLHSYKTQKDPKLCNVIAAGVGMMALNHYYGYDPNDWLRVDKKPRLKASGKHHVEPWKYPTFTHEAEKQKYLDAQKDQEHKNEQGEVLRRQKLKHSEDLKRKKQMEAGIEETCIKGCDIDACTPSDSGNEKGCAPCVGKCAPSKMWNGGKFCGSYIRHVRYKGAKLKVQYKSDPIADSNAKCGGQKIAYSCSFYVVCP